MVQYVADRLTLEHPEDWSVVSHQGRNEGLFMGIHELAGTNSARIFVTIYDAQAPFAAEDVAAMHLNSLPDALAGLPVTETGRKAVTADLGGRSVEGFSVQFSVPVEGQPQSHTVRAFTWKAETRTAAVVTQLADQDGAREQAEMDRILQSLAVQ